MGHVCAITRKVVTSPYNTAIRSTTDFQRGAVYKEDDNEEIETQSKPTTTEKKKKYNGAH